MSMKFLSGLQDLLGLYDSNASTSQHSPSTPIPPSSPVFTPPQTRGSRKTIQEINSLSSDDSPVQRCSHERSVRFVEEIVTGYSEAPKSPFKGHEDESPSAPTSIHGPDPEEILSNYKRVCERAKITPNSAVIRQIGYMHRTAGVRQENLSLKGERVSHADMEALEAVFKLVQFDSLDFEYTFLDDDSVISLSEMMEFYDSTQKLNLSFNRQITNRAWVSVFRAVKNCNSLQLLNLRYTSVDNSLSALCRCLRSQPPPALACLHLENVSLSGKSLLLLTCALKHNVMLKELFLGENNLQPADGTHLHSFIIANTALQMLDLRNNELGDQGLRHICDALKHQETLTHSALTALVLWNNRVSHQSMDNLAMALIENHHLETLNIGSNALGLDGISRLKIALAGKSNLHRLGLQQTNMNCEAAIVLAECLADNNEMIRVDLRENPKIGSAGLLALHSAMKMNTSITNMNLDETCTVPTSEKVRPYQDEFRRYYDEIRDLCERNKQAALQRMAVKTTDEEDTEKKHKTQDTEETGESERESAKVEEMIKKEQQLPPIKQRNTRFCRSASLTCQETITDIPERIRQMSGSTHSLDETSNPDSIKTIKKFSVSSNTSLGKSEWGSLPAIPQSVKQEEQLAVPSGIAGPIVRKTRRFSVSPTSSTFNVNTESSKFPTTISHRPHSLSISIPVTSLSTEQLGPSSAPTSSSLASLTNLDNEITIRDSAFEHVAAKENTGSKKEYEEATADDEAKERRERMMILLEGECIEIAVKRVVDDLVNYVVYEETSQVERKASLLLGTCFVRPDPQQLLATLLETTPSSTPLTPSTPSRFCSIVEELTDVENDEQNVEEVLRSLIRGVLTLEKEAIQAKRKQRVSCFLPSSE